jgi:hypothetical protein
MSSEKKDIYNIFFDIDSPVAKFRGFYNSKTFISFISVVNDDDLLLLSLRGLEHHSKSKITKYPLRHIASWGFVYNNMFF